MLRMFPGLALLVLLASTAQAAPPEIPIDSATAEAGGTITRSGKPAQLIGTPLRVGQPVPATVLVTSSLQQQRLTDFKGQVLLLSIVPSLDTGVCERQTQMLAQMQRDAPATIRFITISRDLPFAQARFAEAENAGALLYLSDYAQAQFGRDTGLLVKELMLLARAVAVVDREGVVRYLQVVPDMAHLPDLDRALAAARALAE